MCLPIIPHVLFLQQYFRQGYCHLRLGLASGLLPKVDFQQKYYNSRVSYVCYLLDIVIQFQNLTSMKHHRLFMLLHILHK